MLLSRPGGIPAPVARSLLDHADEISMLEFIGLSPGVVRQAKLLLSVTGLPEDFSFSTLSLGSSGPEVAYLEEKLTALTYRPSRVDRVFDARTRHAVVAFQKWEGLSRDGVVD